MPRTKQHPLIAATINELPKKGESFPADQKAAWLKLMAMALDTVYGGQPFGGDPLQPYKTVTQSAKLPHRFVIDDKGYAKNSAGKRILPKDVGTTPIFDMRGELGDMREIIWADESKGLNGADLVITA
jgi:hypothetical protein